MLLKCKKQYLISRSQHHCIMLRRCCRIFTHRNIFMGVCFTILFLFIQNNIQISYDKVEHKIRSRDADFYLSRNNSRKLSTKSLEAVETKDLTELISTTTSEDVDRYYHTDWVEVAGSDRSIFLYSAYYDTRTVKPTIRLIAITKKKATVKGCQFWTHKGKTQTTKASIKLIRENWGMAYSASFITCEDFSLPKGDAISEVAVVLSSPKSLESRLKVISLESRNWEGSFSVCVKAFHYEFNRAVWLVEFIELYRILGVTKFFFYNHTVGVDVEKVLQYYMKENIVEVFSWSLPVKSQKDIRTEGIFAALNDCNLRNVGLFHHVLMIDLDEFIIPRTVNNYTALINTLGPKSSGYIFQNVFFYLYWDNDTVASSSLYGSSDKLGMQLYGSESEGPYLLTAYKTIRLTKPHPHRKRSKYIVKPEYIIECGNHMAGTRVPGSPVTINVKSDVALVHHYRICEFGGFDCLKDPHEIDRTAHKYLPTLFKVVAKMCSSIFPTIGKCPKAPPLGSPY